LPLPIVVVVSNAVDIRHEPGCQYARGFDHSDAAKRVSDTYNLHRIAGQGLGLQNVGKVFAVALSDGTSDGVLYDNIKDAIRHQKHNAKWYAYLRVGREGMTPCNAASILKLHRDADEAGLKFVDREDPSYGMEVIPRLTVEDQFRMNQAIAARTWIPGRN
jgi:hypothetical protein